MIVTILTSLAIILLSLYLVSFYRLLRIRRLFKWVHHGPRLPIVGSVLEFRGHTETLNDFARLTNNPDKSSYLEFVLVPNLISANYDFMEFVLSSPDILDKSHDYDFFHDWLGLGLLTSTGPKWRKRRKIITHAFHFNILEQFVDIFEANSAKMIQRLQQEALDQPSVNIYTYITSCALDTICEAAMGVNINTQDHQNQEYVAAVRDICKIMMNRTFSAWKSNDFLFRLSNDYRRYWKDLKVLHGFSNSVIQKRRAELERNQPDEELDKYSEKKRKLALLDLLLKSTVDGQPLSQEDIREEVDTFMFEGHDTTSAGISFAIYLLASHPEVQQLARDEQMQILQNNRDQKLTIHDLQDMKYLELVIKETLRLYPPVPLVGRELHKDVMYKGNIIPKKTAITLFIYGIHRDPDYFESPLEFKPERFLDIGGKHPYSYVPFSAGPRNCIGQKFAMLEMKSMLSCIIRNFELLPADPPHELVLSSEVILKTLNGVKIKLRKLIWEDL